MTARASSLYSQTLIMDGNKQVALCLSGGGFRATFFHLGIIRFLRDVGILSNISHISSVSGGSILAAHLCQNWKRYTGDDTSFQFVTDELVAFAQRDIRGRILRRKMIQMPIVWLDFLLKRWQPTSLLQSYLDALYKGQTLKAFLPQSSSGTPELNLLTTSMTTGGLCWFSKQGFSRADDNGITNFPNGLLPISLAVAASAAFPPLFPPVILSRKLLDASAEAFPYEVEYLTDGGVYDNIGIRQLHTLVEKGETKFDLVIISDASAAFDWQLGITFKNIIPRTHRATDILMNRVGRLEAEGIKVRTKLGSGKFISLSIHDVVPDDILPASIDQDLQRRIGKLRTDLDRFSSLEIRQLVQHGYEVAFKALSTALQIQPPAIKSPDYVMWNPCPLSSDIKSIGLDAKALERGRIRSWGLWNWKDYASYVLLVMLLAPIAGVGYLAYENLEKTGIIQYQQVQQAVLVNNLRQPKPVSTIESVSGFRGARMEGADRLVVFVHGLYGDPRASWLNDSSGAYWPDLLRQDVSFNRFDIFVLAYPSKITSSIDSNTIAAQIKTEFIERGLLSEYKQVFIISHGIGGVLTQKGLLNLFHSGLSDAAKRVKAIFILGPISGVSSIATWVARFNTHLADLATLNNFLESVTREWNQLDSPIPTFCAIPAVPIFVFGIKDPIITPDPATLNCDSMTFSSDRFQIAKPEGTDDLVYRWARNRIINLSVKQ